MHKEFTHKGYTSLLQAALDNKYHFVNFQSLKVDNNEKICVMRHDIDVDLNAAYEMAKIEASVNVKSTYFLMLRSPVYNLFSRSNHRLVNEIIQLGQEIALHYDEAFYSKEIPLNELINEEATIIENMFGKKIHVVSFHQPSIKIVENVFKLENFINTYDKQDLKGIHYISDSNKVWKAETPWDIFENSIYKKMQLLIHPIWWMTAQEDTTENLWSRSIINNFKREEQQIFLTERAYGAKREIFLK